MQDSGDSDRPSRLSIPAPAPANADQAEARARELLSRARRGTTEDARALRSVIALHELMGRLSQTREVRAMLRTAVRGAREQLEIDRLAVFLRDGEFVRGTWGTDEQGNLTDEWNFHKRVSEISEHEMIERAFQQQDYVAVHEGTELVLGDRTVGTGWNAMVALWYGGEALGWIAFDNLLTGRELDPFQVEVMKLFAAGIAQALVRTRAEADLRELNRELEARVTARTAELNTTNEALARANAELQKLTRIDGLTGIANRRFFDESLAREWGRCARNQQSLAVVMLDVDYFKQYNDSLGHVEGDTALKQVAGAARASILRPADLAARYGGEEFVLLLPETDLGGAQALAERLRERVEEMHLPHPKSATSPWLTVSLGVAATVANEGSATDLVSRADSALYKAKEAGRNRVALAD